MASRKQEHIEQITERCLIAQKKNLVSRNGLRETENIGATDLDELIANFLLQVREFLFLICVKKTISMKILVSRVINSSSHRNCFVRGYIHSLFVSKALTSSYLALRAFTQKTREYLRICSCLACIYRVMDARGKFGEHERCVRFARGGSRVQL